MATFWATFISASGHTDLNFRDFQKLNLVRAFPVAATFYIQNKWAWQSGRKGVIKINDSSNCPIIQRRSIYVPRYQCDKVWRKIPTLANIWVLIKKHLANFESTISEKWCFRSSLLFCKCPNIVKLSIHLVTLYLTMDLRAVRNVIARKLYSSIVVI